MGFKAKVLEFHNIQAGHETLDPHPLFYFIRKVITLLHIPTTILQLVHCEEYKSKTIFQQKDPLSKELIFFKLLALKVAIVKAYFYTMIYKSKSLKCFFTCHLTTTSLYNYLISSNMRLTSNKRLPLTSAAPLRINISVSASSNKHLTSNKGRTSNCGAY